jgi:uncharacterized protein (DUF1330 family)
MNWDAIAASGETIGALAVVLTLFYLARQIHQNTRMVRATMTKDLYLASRAAIMDVTASDRLAEIWAEIRPFEDEAAARRHTFYQSFFRLYELQFNLARQDLLDDSIATSYLLVIRMFARTRHFEAYWSKARVEFHEDFAGHVDEQLRFVRSEAAAVPPPSATSFEMQIAIHVRSDDEFRAYRDAIAPILDRYGGRLVHDFRVSEVFVSEADLPVNRISMLRFPDEQARRAFFEDSEYLSAKERYLEAAIAGSEVLAAYRRS